MEFIQLLSCFLHNLHSLYWESEILTRNNRFNKPCRNLITAKYSTALCYLRRKSYDPESSRFVNTFIYRLSGLLRSMWVLVSCGVEIMIFTPEPQKPPRVVMPKGSVLLTLYATPNLLSKDGTVLKTSCVTLKSLFKQCNTSMMQISCITL